MDGLPPLPPHRRLELEATASDQLDLEGDEEYDGMTERELTEDPEKGYRIQLKEKIEKMQEMNKREEEPMCRIREDGSVDRRTSEDRKSREFGSFSSGYYTDTGSSYDLSDYGAGASYMELFNTSMEGRTISEVFREKYGDNATDRVYGFTTESLDYLKDHPDLQIPGNNPVRIPHDDFVAALHGNKNMFLAHEIAINEEFRLERFQPAEDSLEGRVQTQMQKAFWNSFQANLLKTPPEYNQALAVFEELKTSLLELLLPHNHNMRKRINETLDVELIKRQVEQDCFDIEEFQTYATFVVDTLGQLCCPFRDADIEALRSLEGVAKIFRGILRVMDDMKVDMANFYIQQFRPSIIRQVVEYERVNFAKFLEVEYMLRSDGLRITKNWLMRHKIGKRDIATVMSKAFGELLVYDMKFGWPETLTLDLTRLTDIAQELQRLGIIGACLLTTGSMIQMIFGIVKAEFRDTFKKHLKILITEHEAKDEKRLKECLERVAEQAVFLVNEFIKRELKRSVEESERLAIRNCVMDVANRDHKIRTLLVRRVIDYAEEICLADYGTHVTMPAGLSSIQFEAAYTIGQFQRVVRHNRGIYDDMYMLILEKMNTTPKFHSERVRPGSGGVIDKDLDDLLKMLREPMVDEAIRAELVAKEKMKVETELRKQMLKKLEAERIARRRAENPLQAMLEDEREETARKLEEAKSAALARLHKNDPNTIPQLGDLPMKMVCQHEFGTPEWKQCQCVPCVSSNTTQDTTCSTAISIPDEEVQESWEGKKTWKMTPDERRGLYDEESFKIFCCEGEARRQRLHEKVALAEKPKPPCGPVNPDEHHYVTNQLLMSTLHRNDNGLNTSDDDIPESTSRTRAPSIKFDDRMFADGIAALLLQNNVPVPLDTPGLLFDDPKPGSSDQDRKSPDKVD